MMAAEVHAAVPWSACRHGLTVSSALASACSLAVHLEDVINQVIGGSILYTGNEICCKRFLNGRNRTSKVCIC